MKIRLFGTKSPQKNPAEPLGVKYGTTPKRKSVFKLWLIILSVILLPFVISSGLAFYKLALIGADGKVIIWELAVRTSCPGIIDSINTLSVGKSIQKGDTLAHIHNPDWDEDMALLQIHKQFPINSNQDLQIIENQNLTKVIHLTQSRLQYLKLQHQKIQSLYAENSATQQEFNLSWLQVKESEIELQKLKNELRMISSQSKKEAREITQKYLEDKQKLANAELREKRLWILAPDSGTLRKSSIKSGEFVKQGDLMFNLEQTSKVTLKAEVAPRYIEYLSLGTVGTITFPDKHRIRVVVISEAVMESSANPDESDEAKLSVEILPLGNLPLKYHINKLPFVLNINIFNTTMSAEEQKIFESIQR